MVETYLLPDGISMSPKQWGYVVVQWRRDPQIHSVVIPADFDNPQDAKDAAIEDILHQIAEREGLDYSGNFVPGKTLTHTQMIGNIKKLLANPI